MLISAVTHRQTGSQRQRGIYCRVQGEGERGEDGERDKEGGGLSEVACQKELAVLLAD